MSLKAMGREEITRGAKADRNERRFRDCASMCSEMKVAREMKHSQRIRERPCSGEGNLVSWAPGSKEKKTFLGGKSVPNAAEGPVRRQLRMSHCT